jgi:hypothetical protein
MDVDFGCCWEAEMFNRLAGRSRRRGRDASNRDLPATDDLVGEPAQPPEHAGAGVFLGGILGGILGCLIGVGAVPHPAILHLGTAKPLPLTLVLAGAGAVIGGVTGAIADSSTGLADTRDTPDRDTEARTERSAAQKGNERG